LHEFREDIALLWSERGLQALVESETFQEALHAIHALQVSNGLFREKRLFELIERADVGLRRARAHDDSEARPKEVAARVCDQQSFGNFTVNDWWAGNQNVKLFASFDPR